jgi:hypothetical protein
MFPVAEKVKEGDATMILSVLCPDKKKRISTFKQQYEYF